MSANTLLSLVLAVMSADQAAPVTTVLVAPLQAMGVSQDLAKHSTEFVVEAFVTHPGHHVLTMADVQQLAAVGTTRVQLGCESDSCLAELSRGVRAELLITGSVGLLGDKITVTLALLDVKTAKTRQRATAVLDSAKLVPVEIPRLVAQVMGWSASEPTTRFRLPRGKASSFAVLDLVASGVPELAAANLTQILSAELKRVDGATVINREDIRAMLQVQEDKVRLGCDDMACLAEIGGALGVERLVTGSVGKLADSYVVTLRLISTQKSSVENVVTESFGGTEDQLIPAVRRAGRRLLGVEATDKGSLVVSASEQGARVVLDGEERGAVPLPPLREIEPGRHALQVVRSGYLDWNGDVYVDANEMAAVWVDLQPRPARWYQKWWVWTLMGSAGAGTVVLGTAFLVVVTGVTAGTLYVFTLQQQRTVSGTAEAR